MHRFRCWNMSAQRLVAHWFCVFDDHSCFERRRCASYATVLSPPPPTRCPPSTGFLELAKRLITPRLHARCSRPRHQPRWSNFFEHFVSWQEFWQEWDSKPVLNLQNPIYSCQICLICTLLTNSPQDEKEWASIYARTTEDFLSKATFLVVQDLLVALMSTP